MTSRSRCESGTATRGEAPLKAVPSAGPARGTCRDARVVLRLKESNLPPGVEAMTEKVCRRWPSALRRKAKPLSRAAPAAPDNRRRHAAEAGDFRLKPCLHRTRNRKFESISLQQRVHKPSAPPASNRRSRARQKERSIVLPFFLTAHLLWSARGTESLRCHFRIALTETTGRNADPDANRIAPLGHGDHFARVAWHFAFPFRSITIARPGSRCPASWVRVRARLLSEHVWPRPSFLRCQRDQACVLDPAASADSQLPAELECGADRLPPGGPIRSEGRRAQPGRGAVGARAVLGEGPQGRLFQYQRQGGRD